jgi:hypothetical protein
MLACMHDRAYGSSTGSVACAAWCLLVCVAVLSARLCVVSVSALLSSLCSSRAPMPAAICVALVETVVGAQADAVSGCYAWIVAT